MYNTLYPSGQMNMTTTTGQQDTSKYYYLWPVNQDRFLVLCQALLVHKIVQCEFWHWKLMLWNGTENIRALPGCRELGLSWESQPLLYLYSVTNSHRRCWKSIYSQIFAIHLCCFLHIFSISIMYSFSDIANDTLNSFQISGILSV